MIKALLAIVVIILLIFGAFELWVTWDNYNHNKDLEKQQATSAVNIVPESLPGMPQGWEDSYKKAVKDGAPAIRNWLRNYGQQVQDPRRAWIEMDYMVMISKEDPAEAKRIFADIKGRTPPNSPIYPRIKQLEKTYD
jgi:hypothetical protein